MTASEQPAEGEFRFWYLSGASARRGPISFTDAAQQVKLGNITTATRVCATGMPTWCVLGQYRVYCDEHPSTPPVEQVLSLGRASKDRERVAGTESKFEAPLRSSRAQEPRLQELAATQHELVEAVAQASGMLEKRKEETCAPARSPGHASSNSRWPAPLHAAREERRLLGSASRRSALFSSRAGTAP